MSDPSLIADLIASGTPADLVQRVAMELARASVEREALNRRRDQDRDRQSRRRRLSRDVTENPEQRVTPRDVTTGSPLSPVPPHPPNPNPTPVSDPDGSAEGCASAPEAEIELSVSDRVWTEFPAVLADMGKRSEQSVRGWIGKLMAKHGAEDVYRALAATVEAGTGDPFGYAVRVLKPVKARSPPAQRGSGNGFYDLLRDEFGGQDERNPAPHHEKPRLISGSRH